MPPAFSRPLGQPTFTPEAFQRVQPILENYVPKPPAKVDLMDTFKALSAFMEGFIPMDQVQRRHWARAPWVLFNFPGENEHQIGGKPDFFSYYFQWLDRRTATTPIILLLRSFLKHYPQQLPSFESLREGLERALAKRTAKRLAKWQEKNKRFHFLAKDGPVQFARIILDADHHPENLLAEAGLTGELENQGFSRAAYLECLRTLGHALRKSERPDRLLERILELSTKPADRTQHASPKILRFPNDRSEMANAMLAPFIRRPAHSVIKAEIRRFLLDYLGDPRFPGAKWEGVRPECMQTIRSWLVETSIENFFKVLDLTADEIWKYRKAFWSAYLEKGYIQEAWPILGPRARSILERHEQEKQSRSFGQLKGAYSRDQSALLLRIGELFITEWSHNGMCRIWILNTAEKEAWMARLLYQTDTPYQAPDLRKSADHEIVHRGSERGTWQRNLADIIYRYTNIQFRFSDLMPRN